MEICIPPGPYATPLIPAVFSFLGSSNDPLTDCPPLPDLLTGYILVLLSEKVTVIKPEYV